MKTSHNEDDNIELTRQVHEINEVGQGRLHYAAYAGNALLVKLLIIAGLDPNKQDHYGATPLHYAARGGHMEAVNELLSGGADASRKMDDGLCAAEVAKRQGYTTLARRLRTPSVVHKRTPPPACP